jgi:hypothetical protein
VQFSSAVSLVIFSLHDITVPANVVVNFYVIIVSESISSLGALILALCIW